MWCAGSSPERAGAGRPDPDRGLENHPLAPQPGMIPVSDKAPFPDSLQALGGDGDEMQSAAPKFPAPRSPGDQALVRWTMVALAWSVGLMMTSSTFTREGRVATHSTVSAMSSAVSGVMSR